MLVLVDMDQIVNGYQSGTCGVRPGHESADRGADTSCDIMMDTSGSRQTIPRKTNADQTNAFYIYHQQTTSESPQQLKLNPETVPPDFDFLATCLVHLAQGIPFVRHTMEGNRESTFLTIP